jgi:hypothetical protein
MLERIHSASTPPGMAQCPANPKEVDDKHKISKLYDTLRKLTLK